MGVEGTASDADIIAAVKNAGYGAAVKGTEKNAQSQGATANDEELLKDHKTPILIKRLIASLVFWIVLMYMSMGHMMWGWSLPSFMEGNHIMMGIVQMLLVIAIMIINQKFFINGFRSLIHRSPNMDALVAIGQEGTGKCGWRQRCHCQP